MSDKYKENTVSGSSWFRCCNVMVRNDLGVTPKIIFEEQMAIVIGEKTILDQVGGLEVIYDPSQVIKVVDPSTNLPTGEEVTHADIYRLLHSAYIQAAMSRDLQLK